MMVNYEEAFNDGIKAAIDVEKAKKEINSVFEQLNEQIKKITEGKILVERRWLETQPSNLFESIGAITLGTRKKFLALIATNPTIPNAPVKELAKWSTEKMGYPCKLTLPDREEFCEDKEALERALENLLREPTTGDAFRHLIALEPPK